MEENNNELRGIGGWLLFFVIMLTLVGPAFSAVSFNSELSAAAAADPAWAASIDYEDTALGVWFLWGCTTILAIVAGVLLLLRKKPSTVWLAIAVLWIIGPFLNALILIDLASIDEPITAELWVDLARSVIPAGIWTAYLLMSERVANTYNFRRARVVEKGAI